MPDMPNRGVVFWPVGCGDSITLVIDDETIIQIDLHHCAEAESEDDDRAPIIDRLLEILPERDGRPYLAAFGVTHLDQDHVLGFARLLDEVTIGDLWFTPRIFWEQDQDELSEDAKAFVKEAERRISAIKENDEVDSGDRVRIIGYMDAVKDSYDDVPEEAITVPGTAFTAVDGVDLEGVFRAFVHAPFEEDGEGERNDTSFALQVTLSSDVDEDLRVLLLGDLGYPTLKKIFERSEDVDLEWDVLLAPHHCSKKAMYEREDGRDVLRRDILDAFEAAASEDATIVASSTTIPSSDTDGANPPHRKAANRYEDTAPNFVVTADVSPEVIAFAPGADGPVALDADVVAESSVLGAAIALGRGAAKPAGKRVGFGDR